MISSADARGMLKCTVCPWLDEAIEVATSGAQTVAEAAGPTVRATKDGLRKFQDLAEQYFDGASEVMKDGVDAVTGAAEPAMQAAKGGMRKVQGVAQPYMDSAKETFEEITAEWDEWVQDNGLGDYKAALMENVEAGLMTVSDARSKLEDVAEETLERMGLTNHFLDQLSLRTTMMITSRCPNVAGVIHRRKGNGARADLVPNR